MELVPSRLHSIANADERSGMKPNDTNNYLNHWKENIYWEKKNTFHDLTEQQQLVSHYKPRPFPFDRIELRKLGDKTISYAHCTNIQDYITFFFLHDSRDFIIIIRLRLIIIGAFSIQAQACATLESCMRI